MILHIYLVFPTPTWNHPIRIYKNSSDVVYLLFGYLLLSRRIFSEFQYIFKVLKIMFIAFFPNKLKELGTLCKFLKYSEENNDFEYKTSHAYLLYVIIIIIINI